MSNPLLLGRLFSRSVHNPITGCRTWTGSRSSQGRYGTLWFAMRPQYVHRLAYLAANGTLPDGSINHESSSVEVHHTCGNRLCVEPTHLELLTRSEHCAEHQALKAVA